MAVIDTHCHLDLVAERNVSVTESFANAGSVGVEAIVQIATGLQSARFNRDLSRSYESDASGTPETAPALYWTAGLHPEGVDRLHELDELFTLIREHRDDPRFLGIGETGLDYFHTMEYVAQQKDSFARHLDLAVELNLPVVVHTRDDRMYNPDKVGSITDALAMVRGRPSVRGVLHCFTYTEKEALPFVEQGWMVSYSGVITFKNAEAVQQGAVRLPLDCLMVETDAPFLTPIPHRGKPNQPAYVAHTLDFLVGLRAEHCGEDPSEIRARILDNSRKFISWKHNL